MKLLRICKDGGDKSTVWGLFFIEIKSLFSVALLCFENGSRDAYHTHAFNSVSWVLRGRLFEHHYPHHELEIYDPSLYPIITRRTTFHKVVSKGRTWVLTFRGPWTDIWDEYIPGKGLIALTHGRKEIKA